MKTTFVAAFGVVVGLLLVSASGAQSQDAKPASQLKVHVNYSGAGTVDEKHKVYVALWDSPDFVNPNSSSMPVAMQPTSAKDGVVTFDNVKKTPAYVSAVYDASGTWDAQSVPPEGSPLGLYSKAPGQPAAIDLKPGDAASVEVSFDDTVKMKSGKAAR